MSNAEPMSMHERVHHYLSAGNRGYLTPKQSKRARKKDLKNPQLLAPRMTEADVKDELL